MSDDLLSREQLLAEVARLRSRVAALERQQSGESSPVADKMQLAEIGPMLGNIPCGAVVASTSASGEILFVNLEFTAITGYSLEDLPTVTSWIEQAYPDPAYRALVMDNWERDVSETSRDVVYQVRCNSGADKQLLLRAALLPGERMIVTAVDVTAQQQALAELRSSEERFQQMGDRIDQVFWMVQVEPECILYASPAFEKIWGRSVQDLYAEPRLWSACIHPEDRIRVNQAFDRCIRQEREGINEIYRLIRPDGSERVVEDVGRAVLDEQGKAYRITGIAKDITERYVAEKERRKLERRIQESQRIESLATLAGGVAHDFNNLLVGILGNADLAMLQLHPESPARPQLEGIELAARRAADLARQMLAYSGRGRFVVERLDLRTLVEEMAHLMEVSLSKNAVIKYNFTDSVPAVNGDATQIRQVILNLLANASDAIGDASGVISISTGLMDCDDDYLRSAFAGSSLKAGPFSFIEVSDTGIGMDEDVRRRMFDPFFTTKFTGRGLGLAAVLGIIKGHGGVIKVYSEPGRGSTFKVLLPAQMEKSSASEEVLQEATEGTGRTVLLVDDEETVRSVGAAMLRQAGYGVITAQDGHSAVSLFAQRADEIDCVLLDLSMPHMDGQETFRELRQIQADVPVVLMSGYNEQEAVVRFAGKGLGGFIQKPFKLQDLQQVIQDVLG